MLPLAIVTHPAYLQSTWFSVWYLGRMSDLVRVIIPLSFQNKRNEEFGLEFKANLSSWKENYLMINNKILNNLGQTWEICHESWSGSCFKNLELSRIWTTLNFIISHLIIFSDSEGISRVVKLTLAFLRLLIQDPDQLSRQTSQVCPKLFSILSSNNFPSKNLNLL